MSHLRWNPLLGTWTIVAANRQNRPNMPKDWCPFCPGSGKVPDNYDVHIYPNDFPALSIEHTLLPHEPGEPYDVEYAYGATEVILFSPDHNAHLHKLTDQHLKKLVDVWCARQEHYGADKKVKYIFPFENHGPEVGVTMPHPHGQLYAYPFVPLKVQTELQNCREYLAKTGSNLFAAMILTEKATEERVLIRGKHFLVFLPYFTDYPYGLFIVAKEPVVYLHELKDEARLELGIFLKKITGCFETMFDRPFPYMMCIHQSPVNSPEWGNTHAYYRLHIEFYPPLRNATAIKWYASSEMGAWAATNTMAVEESIIHLRAALKRWEEK